MKEANAKTIFLIDSFIFGLILLIDIFLNSSSNDETSFELVNRVNRGFLWFRSIEFESKFRFRKLNKNEKKNKKITKSN